MGPAMEQPDPLVELKFWMQTFRDSERLIMCPPGLVRRVREAVEAAGMSGLFRVEVNVLLEGGEIIVVDENALEAQQRQLIQSARTEMFRGSFFRPRPDDLNWKSGN